MLWIYLYVCFTPELCVRWPGLAIRSPDLVPTQSHPLVPAFLHSSLNTASRLWAVSGVLIFSRWSNRVNIFLSSLCVNPVTL